MQHETNLGMYCYPVNFQASKPLNRALSFMDMDQVFHDEDLVTPTPACKKPRLADQIQAGLNTPTRPVPKQSALGRRFKNQVFLL